MSIQLSDKQEAFLRDKVESGRFKSMDEALNAAILLLEGYEAHYEAKVEDLRRLYQEGLESGESEDFDMDAIIQEAQDMCRARKVS